MFQELGAWGAVNCVLFLLPESNWLRKDTGSQHGIRVLAVLSGFPRGVPRGGGLENWAYLGPSAPALCLKTEPTPTPERETFEWCDEL